MPTVLEWLRDTLVDEIRWLLILAYGLVLAALISTMLREIRRDHSGPPDETEPEPEPEPPPGNELILEGVIVSYEPEHLTPEDLAAALSKRAVISHRYALYPQMEGKK